jgi:hypothetical protein
MDVAEVQDTLEATVVLEATIKACKSVARCNPKELEAIEGATAGMESEVVEAMVAEEDSTPAVEVMVDTVADKLYHDLTHQLFHKEAGPVILQAHPKPKLKYQISTRVHKEEVDMEEPGAMVEEVMAPVVARVNREAVRHPVELREVADVLLELTAAVIAVHIQIEIMKKTWSASCLKKVQTGSSTNTEAICLKSLPRTSSFLNYISLMAKPLLVML